MSVGSKQKATTGQRGSAFDVGVCGLKDVDAPHAITASFHAEQRQGEDILKIKGIILSCKAYSFALATRIFMAAP